MLKEKRISKKKTILLVLIMLLILTLIIYFLGSSFFSGPSTAKLLAEKNLNPLMVQGIKTDFANDFLTKKPYQDLQENANWSLAADQIGRKNPFSEILFSFSQ